MSKIDERAQHVRNLDELRLQAAKYAGSETPLWLTNAIDDEEAAIQRLEQEIEAQHEPDAKRTPATLNRMETWLMSRMDKLDEKIDALTGEVSKVRSRTEMLDRELELVRIQVKEAVDELRYLRQLQEPAPAMNRGYIIAGVAVLFILFAFLFVITYNVLP